MAAKQKCNCNIVMWVVALILMTVGVWALVSGLVAQLNMGVASMMSVAQAVMPWYFVGLLFMGLGKMAVWKSCASCMSHK